jgi:hypothetical protein
MSSHWLKLETLEKGRVSPSSSIYVDAPQFFCSTARQGVRKNKDGRSESFSGTRIGSTEVSGGSGWNVGQWDLQHLVLDRHCKCILSADANFWMTKFHIITVMVRYSTTTYYSLKKAMALYRVFTIQLIDSFMLYHATQYISDISDIYLTDRDGWYV